MEGYRSGQTGRTVNPLADAYGGSNPSPSSWPCWGVSVTLCDRNARVAQTVEHPLGKGEVIGSIPIAGFDCGEKFRFCFARCTKLRRLPDGERAICEV